MLTFNNLHESFVFVELILEDVWELVLVINCKLIHNYYYLECQLKQYTMANNINSSIPKISTNIRNE